MNPECIASCPVFLEGAKAWRCHPHPVTGSLNGSHGKEVTLISHSELLANGLELAVGPWLLLTLQLSCWSRLYPQAPGPTMLCKGHPDTSCLQPPLGQGRVWLRLHLVWQLLDSPLPIGNETLSCQPAVPKHPHSSITAMFTSAAEAKADTYRTP